ncbi:hypothetical protein BKA66DRAFT_110268 [Pyrenochaeta sp. MPI-SDFR-AT-0127]|nr:hypothetical protein BKA66DRAFT_110268 [Pyrenochaeta sp. MPI-SDFR-AT-0127]
MAGHIEPISYIQDFWLPSTRCIARNPTFPDRQFFNTVSEAFGKAESECRFLAMNGLALARVSRRLQTILSTAPCQLLANDARSMRLLSVVGLGAFLVARSTSRAKTIRRPINQYQLISNLFKT